MSFSPVKVLCNRPWLTPGHSYVSKYSFCAQVVMNAALGFDTYLVLRHGMKPPRDQSQDPPSSSSSSSSGGGGAAAGAEASSSGSPSTSRSSIDLSHIPGDKLGCYFCNDVVAPGDVSIILTLNRFYDTKCQI